MGCGRYLESFILSHGQCGKCHAESWTSHLNCHRSGKLMCPILEVSQVIGHVSNRVSTCSSDNTIDQMKLCRAAAERGNYCSWDKE